MLSKGYYVIRVNCCMNTWCHNPFFGLLIKFTFSKNQKNIRTKNKKIQTIITVRRGCQSTQKMTRILVEEAQNSKIKI